MPRTRSPRAGSMQFWPRARARHSHARVRTWVMSKDIRPLGFAGYKAGMTHLLISDNRQHSLTKNMDIFCPVTVVECPPVKTASIHFYKNTINGPKIVSEVITENITKDMARKTTLSKKTKGKYTDDFDFIRVICYTQPGLTGTGRKKPHIFEVAIGGNKEQQLAYAKEKLGEEIFITEVFKEGQQLDAHSITKGKGFQGAVRKFGVTLRHHKSEKSRRNPGSLGAWRAQGHIMWRTAHAGKMGYHLRTEYNKLLVKISNNPSEINIKGGFLNYGIIKNQFILVKGSLSGASGRLIRFTEPIRSKKETQEAPQIAYISLESKQGR
ncbi:50S ribosomal protein L3 [Candidatus Woesearchaeota archaeon]|nr:50S ribosomal protein L3 [Candidatus Woesearchaeota archaeon]